MFLSPIFLIDNPCKYFSTKEEFPKTNEEVIKKHKRNVAQNYDPHPIAIVKGEGINFLFKNIYGFISVSFFQYFRNVFI